MNAPKSSPAGDLAQMGRGLLMGGADIIPGVSGGTVALILGIYERLVTALSHVDLTLVGHLRRRRGRQAAAHVDLRFLVFLACGILAGVVGLATLMNHLLENHLELTLSVFFGLILASSILVARSIERREISMAAFALAGGAFAFWVVGQPFMEGAEGYGYLFLCGMVAICAMILPGISGAFILLIMGKYEDVTEVIRDLVEGKGTLDHALVLAVFAAGCLVGLLTFSKFLRWLLARYHSETLAVLCGFMIGSLRKIWPFKEGEHVDLRHDQVANAWPDAFDSQLVLAMVLAVLAAGFVFALDRLTRRSRGGSTATPGNPDG